MMQKKRLVQPSSKIIFNQIINYIERERIFLLFSGDSIDQIIKAAAYANEKGFNLIAIDIKTPKVKDYLKSLKRKGQRKFGVFYVSSKKEARIAINAGAIFVFSTNLDRGIIRRCNRETTFNSIGSLTPTEIANANELRAKTISLFPCNTMVGISWFILLRDIFPKIKFIPTDFMSPIEASQYLKEGAYAVAPIIDLKTSINADELIENFKKLMHY